MSGRFGEERNRDNTTKMSNSSTNREGKPDDVDEARIQE
jgi:hypothetical protein